jgi:outer membrane immunogenic protein
MEGKDMVNTKLAFANAVAVGALAMSFGTAAVAADLPKRAPAVVVPVSPWTGFYVGAHIGGASSSESVDFVGSTDPSGFLGGLQAGYNWQLAPAWLVGIEGELSWTNASGSVPGFQSNHNWYDTFDARLGYILPWSGWMVYGKAGAAWMNVDYSVPGFGVNQTRAGWNVGVGAEYLIAPHWSVKAEYSFLDFGKDNIPVFGVGADTQVNQFKVGVNYHFAPGSLFGRW